MLVVTAFLKKKKRYSQDSTKMQILEVSDPVGHEYCKIKNILDKKSQGYNKQGQSSVVFYIFFGLITLETF